MIGDRTLKYAAWGDGYGISRIEPSERGMFTAGYGREGRVVRVLAHEADESYERGQSLHKCAGGIRALPEEGAGNDQGRL
jgi:3-phenylpropionate/trans-cinnamate dioxygenase ferredoxin reductase component